MAGWVGRGRPCSLSKSQGKTREWARWNQGPGIRAAVELETVLGRREPSARHLPLQEMEARSGKALCTGSPRTPVQSICSCNVGREGAQVGRLRDGVPGSQDGSRTG